MLYLLMALAVFKFLPYPNGAKTDNTSTKLPLSTLILSLRPRYENMCLSMSSFSSGSLKWEWDNNKYHKYGSKSLIAVEKRKPGVHISIANSYICKYGV